MQLDNIKVVMIGTTHPGNIGAAARAMNNMCISRMCLVNPECPVGEIAYARASGAHAVLDQRQTCDSLAAAIADCNFVVATSARRRSLSWPELNPRQLAEKITAMSDDNRVALVFGREHSGLTNEELQLCNCMLNIPTNPDFSSLNVAAAIQVVCYEIFGRFETVPPTRPVEVQDQPASSAEVEGYFEHLRQALESSGFIDPAQPGLIMQRLRRLYLRCDLSRNEINILRGILTALEKREK